MRTLATFCLALAFLGSGSAEAQLPAPRLLALFPAGAKQGSQVEVTIASAVDLEGAYELRFSHPGITATRKLQPVEGKPEPQPVENVFVVSVAADVPTGLYEARARGIYGLSNPRLFAVDDRTEAVEVEPNGAAAQATVVANGAIVNGRLQEARDIDWLRFPAQAGQRLLVEAWAARIDSRLDATIELYDPAGRLVEVSRDDLGRDPLIDATLPADGEYAVRVFDATYGGGPDYFYRLSIGPTPRVDFVLPNVVTPGQPARVTLFGRNLPGASPADGVTIQGRSIEQVDIDLPIPASADPLALLWGTPLRPSALGTAGFAYRHATPSGAASPVLIGWAEAPVAREQEPNDDAAAPQTLSVPCDLVGQFAPRRDVDHYSFTAEKGQALAIRVLADRMGSAAKAYLRVEQITQDAAGKEQAKTIVEGGLEPHGNVGPPSCDTRTDDPDLRFTAPETGTYRIVLRDLFHEVRGDPRLVYRLIVRPEQPDFHVAVLSEFPGDANATPNLWSANVAKGGTTHLTAVVERTGGFAGPVELSVSDLPAAVTCPGAIVAANQTTARLVITADESAADWAGPLRVVGQATLARPVVGNVATQRMARAAVVVRDGNTPLKLPAVTRLARGLELGVTGIAPFLAVSQSPTTSVVQSARFDLPVQVTRRGEFKGVVTLTGLGLPEKVQNDTHAVAAEQTAGLVRLFVPQDAPPGTYSFYLQASAPVPFTKSPEGKDKKDVPVTTPSTPVRLTIEPGPLVLGPQPPGGGAIKQGASIEIPVGVNRRLEYAGPVTLDLLIPPTVAGVSAAEVVVPADQSNGKLVVQAAADATVGNHPYVAVRARLTWKDKPIEIHQPIPLNVQQ